MRKIAVIIITTLLLAVIALQILAALNIFPRQERVEVCPVDAISMQGGKAVIDRQKCIGCQRCVIGIKVTQAGTNKLELSGAPASTPSSPSAGSTEPRAGSGDGSADVDAPFPPVSKARVGERQPPATNNPPATTPTPATPVKPVAGEAKHTVDAAVCIGCGLCTIYCPTDAIKMVGGKAVIDPKKCINCGICANGNGAEFKGCPVKAISGP